MFFILGMSRDEYINHLKLTNLEKEQQKRYSIFAAAEREKRHLRSEQKRAYLARLWLDLNNNFCINKIENFIKSLMIRRTNFGVFDGNFVEKEEEIILCRLNDEERILYNKISKMGKEKYNNFEKRMINKLRQICGHPSIAFTDFKRTENVMDIDNVDILKNVIDAVFKRVNQVK